MYLIHQPVKKLIFTLINKMKNYIKEISKTPFFINVRNY